MRHPVPCFVHFVLNQRVAWAATQTLMVLKKVPTRNFRVLHHLLSVHMGSNPRAPSLGCRLAADSESSCSSFAATTYAHAVASIFFFKSAQCFTNVMMQKQKSPTCKCVLGLAHSMCNIHHSLRVHHGMRLILHGSCSMTGSWREHSPVFGQCNTWEVERNEECMYDMFRLVMLR